MRFKNKKVAIIGLGMEGKDALVFLKKEGAKVTVFDQKEKNELDLSAVKDYKVNFICGKDYLSCDFSGFDYIVRSPGVYPYKRQLIKAQKQGVKITSPIKIFFDRYPAKIIGVTGTKGKGTTSTLIYKILKRAKKKVFLAGNIGIPYLSLLERLNRNSWVVMELSSFQLIDLTKSPHIAVVLNITTDHLDWHKDRKEYINAKKNIVRYQKIGDYAVLNADYKVSKSFAKITCGKTYFFRRSNVLKDLNPDKLLLRGEHNWENVAAAVCVAKLAGADEKVIKKVVYSFKGLEHRLELVGTHKGVTFYNDSFSTNPEPAIAAVRAFSEPITIILGGYDKGLDYRNLGLVISKQKNVNNVILIGDTAEKIKSSLLKAKYGGNLIELGKPSMKEIVKVSFESTAKGGVVILSPASASFDMFPNYKERGKKFKEAFLVFQKQ